MPFYTREALEVQGHVIRDDLAASLIPRLQPGDEVLVWEREEAELPGYFAVQVVREFDGRRACVDITAALNLITGMVGRWEALLVEQIEERFARLRTRKRTQR